MSPAAAVDRGARAFARWPIRHKLLALTLLPLLGVLPLLGLVLLLGGSAAIDRLLITKVRSDLAVAHGYFERVRGEVAASTGAVADAQVLQSTLAAATAGDAQAAQALQALLQRLRLRERLDYLHLRRPDGRLLQADFDGAREAGPPPLPGVVPERPVATLAVLPPAQQGLLAPALRARVAVPLVDTRNARPSARVQEDRALVLQALVPVVGPRGVLLGWVQGGVLLNRNLPFIDHINAIVYPDGALPFGSHGTATLFLDDVRVSTNVRLFERPAGDLDGLHVPAEAPAADDTPAGDGTRAIGTRVSAAVREAVLERGSTWLDRAFVVDAWYVSAYEPLVDAAGQRVGMLYVGFLERPFTWLKYGVLAGTGLVFFGVMLGAAVLALRWARQIFGPIERMARTMAEVERGRLDARVGALSSADEIGALAGHLDHLLDTIADKTAALERWNAELDAKVAQRTAALEARTRELQAAQSQLLRTEKMAAVGQLTASIAHEVNNPIAVIQGNLDLARELLGPDARRVDEELTLIDQQVERMRLIVTQLLQYSRPTDYAGYVEPVDCARALEDCLRLAAHQLQTRRITVERRYQARRAAGINRTELQQVLVNLIVNALHAMPDGGRLTLATEDAEDARQRPGVRVSVADTGPGLSPEVAGRLFQPFVTSKQDGTGLGLWISRSLVERYGGELSAHDRTDGEGHGAVLALWLLCEPEAVGEGGG